METKICYIIRTDSLKYFKEGTIKSTYKYTEDITKARKFDTVGEALQKMEEMNDFYNRNQSILAAFGNWVGQCHVMKATITTNLELI